MNTMRRRRNVSLLAMRPIVAVAAMGDDVTKRSPRRSSISRTTEATSAVLRVTMVTSASKSAYAKKLSYEVWFR